MDMTPAEHHFAKRQYLGHRPEWEKSTSELLQKIAAEHKSGLLTDVEYIERTAMVSFDYAIATHGTAA